MIDASDDFAELQKQLQAFEASIPQILRRTKLTEELAKDVEATLSVAKSHFTLAIAGQMKAGKSTLINAIVGSDLAITGVNETTATVNWFRYGTTEQSQQFRVVWNDGQGSTDVFPLSDKEKWIGDSTLAAQTRYLEFFSPAEFLKKVNVVDTPGTRSTIESHGNTSQGFLHASDRAEASTLRYGGIADCICYVLPPVTRVHDNEFLGKFASESRLPQSTPYNSVGLLHKWETVESQAPWVVATRQAETAFQALKNYVCDVFPVSGPLGRACQECPPEFWQDVIEMTTGTTSEAFELLTSQESSFTRVEPECALSIERRKCLRATSQLPWPCFKVVLRLARSKSFASGSELLSAVRDISGIDQLLEFLDRRFFDRSRLIHASTVLCRALRVTELARGRIRDRRSELDAHQLAGRHALEEIPMSDKLPKCRAFIEGQLAGMASESRNLELIQRDIELKASSVRQSFEAFEKDCQAVQMMDDQPDLFAPEENVEILRLLGAYGTSLADRLGSDISGNEADMLFDRLDYWMSRRASTSNDTRRVIDQVISRLESVLHQLENSA